MFNRQHALQALEILILDEVSMLSGELFDILDAQLREIRYSEKPFGGIQLIMGGDFLQLPPVRIPLKQQTWVLLDSTQLTQDKMAVIVLPSGDSLTLNCERGFAFQSSAWKELDPACVELTHCFRQEDRAFVALLNRVRRGEHTAEDMRKLNTPHYNPPSATPVQLHTTRARADAVNQTALARLTSAVETFLAEDWVVPFEWAGAEETKENATENFKNFQVKDYLGLKQGTPVMLLANVSLAEQLANGSTGKLVAWATPEEVKVALSARMTEVGYISLRSLTSSTCVFCMPFLRSLPPCLICLACTASTLTLMLTIMHASVYIETYASAYTDSRAPCRCCRPLEPQLSEREPRI
jgi:ATP-dependent DNA helicase PIF1